MYMGCGWARLLRRRGVEAWEGRWEPPLGLWVLEEGAEGAGHNPGLVATGWQGWGPAAAAPAPALASAVLGVMWPDGKEPGLWAGEAVRGEAAGGPVEGDMFISNVGSSNACTLANALPAVEASPASLIAAPEGGVTHTGVARVMRRATLSGEGSAGAVLAVRVSNAGSRKG